MDVIKLKVNKIRYLYMVRCCLPGNCCKVFRKWHANAKTCIGISIFKVCQSSR